jgi:exodeoxyribonuclease-3
LGGPACRPGASAVRLLAWNILHGGGPRRTPEILLALLEHRPDVVVLTEFRPARGSLLRSGLADRGLAHQASSFDRRGVAPEAPNGILVASRFPLADGQVTDPQPPPRGRWLEVCVPSAGLRIGAAHVQDDTRRSAKAAFWQFLVRTARRRAQEKCLIVGDFNTGRRGQDCPSPTACESLLGTFSALGFADAWRHLHPAGREFSWFSSEGEGRRIDSVFLAQPLLPLLQASVYSQVERCRGLSDHAVLVVDLDLGAAQPAPHLDHRRGGLFTAQS